MSMTPVPPEMKRLEPFEMALRETGLGYPEVTEDFPWGHRTLKVKGKAFIFLALSGEGLSMSMKLPHSNGAALMLPFAQPTGYGLGKSGWVTATFGPRDTPPVEMLRKWLDESYRAVAPKKLVAQLDGAAPPAAKKTARSATRKTAAKKTPASSRARRT
jgi:predicted DNA-binding protein (MmcQ/YjbR family)